MPDATRRAARASASRRPVASYGDGVRFSEATAVRKVGESRYEGTVHDGGDIGGNANGGYLMAIAARAMADHAGRPPLTVTGHYLRPGPPGDCVIDVATIKTGRRIVTVRRFRRSTCRRRRG